MSVFCGMPIAFVAIDVHAAIVVLLLGSTRTNHAPRAGIPNPLLRAAAVYQTLPETSAVNADITNVFGSPENGVPLSGSITATTLPVVGSSRSILPDRLGAYSAAELPVVTSTGWKSCSFRLV
jgi:hypothetical protein